MEPVIDLILQHDVPVQVHTGWSAFSMANMYGRPGYQTAWHWAESMGALMSTFPDLKLILGHAGGGFYFLDGYEAFRLLYSFDNAYIDTAKTTPQIVTEAVKGVGAERVMFGSDWNRPELATYGPYTDRAVYQHWWNLNTIANADLTEDQKDWILYKSARKLLKLPPA